MRIGLYDQLGPIRFNKAVALGRKIVEAVDNRDEQIKVLGLDPKFAYPDANWNNPPNDYREAYKRLATLDWEEVKFLRIRGKNFTGFNLQQMRPDTGTSLDPINMECDKSWPKECPQDLLNKWNGIINGLPDNCRLRVKNILGEMGWWVDGHLINSDTVGYQERMYLLYNAGLLNPNTKRVFEIGGGYGALAYGIMEAISDAKYWICDLPECLLFSGTYLTMTTDLDVRLYPEIGDITLLPNYLFEKLSCGTFDLFINTLSFAEMTEYQVRKYAMCMQYMTHAQSKLFEQNHVNNDLPDGTHQRSVRDILEIHGLRSRRELTAPFPIINGPASVWGN